MEPPEFTVTRRRTGDIAVVAPEGEIDLATINELEEALRAAGEGAGRVLLDLRAVTFIDSAGVRLVLEAMRTLPDFAVVRGGPEVTRVFRLVGLEDRVPLVDSPPDE
ncbi:MAG TPA: STAS domain-containing protein [Solirubrobacter sp.]|nr:STAS domain-containing protein [Solirubrobacter sp.]